MKKPNFSGVAAAATRGFIWDFALKGTGLNLLFVIAPLQGVVESTSLLAQKYMIPIASTNFERSLLGSTIGAFWQPGSETKYNDLASWDSASSLSGKFGLATQYAQRAYLSGLFGVDPKTGKSNVEWLWSGDKKASAVGNMDLGQLWEAVDKTNVAFSAILAVASPLAEPLFSNIKAANFGRKFRAIGHGIGEVYGLGMGKALEKKLSSGNANFAEKFMASGFNRLSNMVLQGTVEETIVEQVIETGFLRFIPFNLMFGTALGPQISEVLQEILSPSVSLRAGAHADFWQSMGMGGGRIAGFNFKSDVTEEQVKAAETLKGMDFNTLKSNPEALKTLASTFASGTEIIVNENDGTKFGYERAFTVSAKDNEKAWKHFFSVRSEMANQQAKLDAAANAEEKQALLYSLQIEASGTSKDKDKVKKEAAERTIAANLGAVAGAAGVDEATAIANVITNRGIFELKDKNGNNPFYVNPRYIIEERLAFDQQFNKQVYQAGKDLLSKNTSFVPNSVLQPLLGAKETFWSNRSATLTPQLQERLLKQAVTTAEYIGTRIDSKESQARWLENRVERLNNLRAWAEGLNEINKSNTSELGILGLRIRDKIGLLGLTKTGRQLKDLVR
ncbi:MAG: hypothetical protein WC561_05265, partial [Candidatus Omnitrophota bacterium]